MSDDFQPNNGSGSSNTLGSNLQPTVSPNLSRSSSPGENRIHRENSNSSSVNEPNHYENTISLLENVVSSYNNNERTKIQALSELLSIINQQEHVSESQKSQAYDQYSAEILSIESARNRATIRSINLNPQSTSENELLHGGRLSDRRQSKSKREPSERDDSDDSDTTPSKRSKLEESDMPWWPKSLPPSPHSQFRPSVNPSCITNAKQLYFYSDRRKRVKDLVRLSAYAPDNIPSSQWDRILKGETVDLNVILSSLHHTGIDQERKGSIGDKEITLAVSESKRVVRNGFEWSQAWRRASRAIGFLFPNRVEELEAYGDYIEGLFAARTHAGAQAIILFDIAVRNLVQGGQRHLLTDIQSFSALYTAIVLPDGIESNHSSSSKAPAASSSTRASGSKVDICNRYNSPSGCPMSDAECRYRHICRKCRRAGHGQPHCNAEKK